MINLDKIMNIHPIDKNNDFVAFVNNIDISKNITKTQAKEIDELINKYAVIIFRNQKITDEQQIKFTENFGEIEESGSSSNITKPNERRLSTKLADVSNIDKNLKVFNRDDSRRIFNLGNRLWHSDSSFKEIPAKYSLLSAKSISIEGGNTEFADMRAAYDKLDLNVKLKINKMVCEHSLIYSRQRLGFDMTDKKNSIETNHFVPVEQPLVRTIPMTKRKLIYLSSHIGKIKGWLRPDSMCFINDLIEYSTSSEFVYVHKWQKNDLLMWDNRQTMHRVRHFDDTKEYRDMRRTTVLGEEKLI